MIGFHQYMKRGHGRRPRAQKQATPRAAGAGGLRKRWMIQGCILDHQLTYAIQGRKASPKCLEHTQLLASVAASFHHMLVKRGEMRISLFQVSRMHPRILRFLTFMLERGHKPLEAQVEARVPGQLCTYVDQVWQFAHDQPGRYLLVEFKADITGRRMSQAHQLSKGTFHVAEFRSLPHSKHYRDQVQAGISLLAFSLTRNVSFQHLRAAVAVSCRDGSTCLFLLERTVMQCVLQWAVRTGVLDPRKKSVIITTPLLPSRHKSGKSNLRMSSVEVMSSSAQLHDNLLDMSSDSPAPVAASAASAASAAAAPARGKKSGGGGGTKRQKPSAAAIDPQPEPKRAKDMQRQGFESKEHHHVAAAATSPDDPSQSDLERAGFQSCVKSGKMLLELEPAVDEADAVVVNSLEEIYKAYRGILDGGEKRREALIFLSSCSQNFADPDLTKVLKDIVKRYS